MNPECAIEGCNNLGIKKMYFFKKETGIDKYALVCVDCYETLHPSRKRD